MKIPDYLITKPARFFLLAALLWGGFMCFLNYKDGANFSWHDLLVEANGMVFDLLVFGILLSIYEELRQKKEKIERLHEEIDDYRGWDEKEAMYRIVGAVRRLNKLRVTNINLHNCFLQDAQFSEIFLMSSNLRRADLQGANLRGANLREANLQGVILRGANLQGANLQGANLDEGFIEWTDFWIAIHFGGRFKGSYKVRGSIEKRKASLVGTNIIGVIVDTDWFEKLEKWQVVGREEIKEKYLIDKYGRLELKKEALDTYFPPPKKLLS